MSKKKDKEKTEDVRLSKDEFEDIRAQAEKSAEYLSQLKRLAAEFDNYKKRMIREQSNAIELSSKNLILKLLPIIDDLERALRAIDEGQGSESIANGVQLTYSDIKKLLEDEGVEEVDPETGNEFDPSLHEAVANVSSKMAENCIVEVLQKGYKIKGHIVRPAMVTVSCK